MQLEVRRNRPTLRSTTGRLAIDGQPECVTLEPPPVPDSRGNGTVSISSGTFPLTIRWSVTHQKKLPHVENVPGRTAIEIHNGNFPGDTKGCCMVGKDYGTPEQPDYISHSDVTLNALMTKLYADSTLTNPDSPEMNHVWECGTITYVDFLGAS